MSTQLSENSGLQLGQFRGDNSGLTQMSGHTIPIGSQQQDVWNQLRSKEGSIIPPTNYSSSSHKVSSEIADTSHSASILTSDKSSSLVAQKQGLQRSEMSGMSHMSGKSVRINSQQEAWIYNLPPDEEMVDHYRDHNSDREDDVVQEINSDDTIQLVQEFASSIFENNSKQGRTSGQNKQGQTSQSKADDGIVQLIPPYNEIPLVQSSDEEASPCTSKTKSSHGNHHVQEEDEDAVDSGEPPKTHRSEGSNAEDARFWDKITRWSVRTKKRAEACARMEIGETEHESSDPSKERGKYGSSQETENKSKVGNLESGDDGENCRLLGTPGRHPWSALGIDCLGRNARAGNTGGPIKTNNIERSDSLNTAQDFDVDNMSDISAADVAPFFVKRAILNHRYDDVPAFAWFMKRRGEQ